MSLRSRVLVGLALIGLVASVAAVAVTLTTRTYLVQQLDGRLLGFAGGPSTHADAAQDLTNYVNGDDGDGDADPPVVPTDPTKDRPSEALLGKLYIDGTYRAVLNPNVYRTDEATTSLPEIDPSVLSVAVDTYLTVPSTGDQQYRVLVRPAIDHWEVIGLSMEPVEAVSHRMVLIEVLSIAAVLVGLGLVAWWVIRLGVTPMRRMVDASMLIANGDLSVRLDGAGSGTESAALATSLNAMIGRLSDSISERERSEAQLREFVADASHELRTPLTTVLGYAQLHRKGAISGKRQQTDAWTRTEAEASRMKRLVEDMLVLARFDAEPQLRLASIDAKRLVTEVLGDAGRAHPEVTFALGHGPVTADVEAGVMVTADSDRLRQAVINVVNNAAQHGAAHVTATVTVVESDHGERVRIDVADDGPGMTAEIAARATERFVRGDSSRSRSTGGAGLGLAITAAIVDAHEGTLQISSSLGKGTTVSIDIPA
ncbi:sensor histidine kinase [Demequina lutea]|uniref:histidine kinase n=1 Tax=Demequina lutea TaxID=431489 RepID=A0A7Y9ZC74_9MICO|nr:HAMP domain-containing sensor histidine kinase [Demequina lutea]NYI42687.1 two-component system OmpR family sensor kinase [Demequina lutea]